MPERLKKKNGKTIKGKWRIVETEMWDQEALDLVVPAYLNFSSNGLGEMQLVAIGASIDYRVLEREGEVSIEFSELLSKVVDRPDLIKRRSSVS